jgi:drug/metabolite transporter (DMT)-like permease
MVLLWSANYVVAKHVLATIPTMLTIGLRMVISAVAVLVVYRVQRRGDAQRDWDRNDVPILVALGFAGVGLNQIFFLLGLARTNVSHAAIMIGLTPILVLLLASAMKLEHLSPGRLGGMAVALAGVGILQRSDGAQRSASLLGDALVLMAALTFALFTVHTKARLKKISGVTLNTFAYGCSALIMLPVTIWLSADFDFTRPDWTVWTGLVYMALFPSVVCYLIFYWALRWIAASRISALAYFQPLLAILISIPVLGEYPAGSVLAGGALVLVGVFATERL